MKDRDRIFCTEYLVDMNAEAAAIRAGFTPSTARTAAAWIHPEHPKKPEVKKEIDRLIKKREERTQITADKVLKEIAKVSFANILDIVDKNGKLLAEIDRDDAAAIVSITTKSGPGWKEQKIELGDKLLGLKLLGTHLGVFTEKVQIEDADETGVIMLPPVIER